MKCSDTRVPSPHSARRTVGSAADPSECRRAPLGVRVPWCSPWARACRART